MNTVSWLDSQLNPRLLLALSLFALPLAPALAQSGAAPPQINVSGSAEVKVAPDEIDLNVAVETHDPSLPLATEKTDTGVSNALQFLKKSGIETKDIQTDCIRISPEYGNDLARTTPVVYIVEKTIGIKLKAVADFDTVMKGLLANGINVVHGIDFRTSQLRKYRDQARQMAIRAAKEKADAMAAELGVKCGQPYQINVNDGGGSFGWSGSYRGSYGGGFNAMAQQNFSQAAQGDASETGDTLAVGQISVSANVNVAFLIK
jgi:uncharacterized protein YggE